MLTRYGITAPQGLRRDDRRRSRQLAKELGRDHALAPRCGTPAGTRRGCSRPSSTTPRRSPRRRWTAGRGTSTTGASATRSASRSSTARRTPGGRSSSGAKQRDEFVKRAAFALLACLALHDKAAATRQFVDVARADRARCDRRAQLRQEGRELGAARRGTPQSGAQCRPRSSSQAAGGSHRRSRRRAGSARRRCASSASAAQVRKQLAAKAEEVNLTRNGHEDGNETIATTGIREAGRFCWINMLTPEPGGGAATSSARCWAGPTTRSRAWGTSIQVGGSEVGGLFDLDGPHTPPGTQPYIGVMVKVESADASVAQGEGAGRRRRSRRSTSCDRAAWRSATIPTAPSSTSGSRRGAGHATWTRTVHGAPSWFESADHGRGRRRRSSTARLFGWKPEPSADARRLRLHDVQAGRRVRRAG